MRITAFLCLLLLPMTSSAIDFENAIPRRCRQMVLVTTGGWEISTATMQRFERASSKVAWQRVGKEWPVLVGERGLGWGNGLLAAPDDLNLRKTEGDRRAPAGVFRITGAFGTGEQTAGLKLPVQLLTPTLEAVDDPASRYYNRIVDRAQIARPDWRSAELMAALPDYALGLVIAHNPRNLRGAGSCIFLHRWTGRRKGTAGCTVLHARNLTELARWLDGSLEPVLVQLPQAELPPSISARGF